ncbi:glycosyltransferase [Pseudarthrobacter sp. NPDC080039]|uniref:glycosyltransferase n=1 Tax=unclassified Pseudarthrobacter TaxID=2647000 RepID=UPI00344E892C
MPDFNRPAFIETRKGHAFSEMVVRDFERGLLKNGFSKKKEQFSFFWDILGRIAGRVGYSHPIRIDSRPPLVVGLMGLAERQIYPYTFSTEIFPYIWDCWPTRQADWRSFFDRHQFPLVAFTSIDAANFWRQELPKTKVLWLAEAIDTDSFPAGPLLVERNSVLLEIGRRHETAHAVAELTLDSMGAGHMFRKSADKDFLPTRTDLVSALHTNRALLCHPGSVTDPSGRTGLWESMTHRYLEAVATKTLVVGHIPHEMKVLFGFEPGITVQDSDLPDLLEDLHRDAGRFQGLVDKAYRRLLEVATWDVRADQLKNLCRSDD